MPDKQKESKLMAMLERRGYVNKTVSDEEPKQEDPASVRTRPEDDLRYLFGTLGNEAPNVTPAAHQPVPGMHIPVVPAEPSKIAQRPEPRLAERVVPLNQATADRTPHADNAPAETMRSAHRPELRPAERDEAHHQPPVDRAPPASAAPPERQRPMEREQPRSQEALRPAPSFAAAAPAEDDLDEGEAHAQPHVSMPSFERPLQQPPAESYTDKYLDIDELYEALALKSKRTDTIYLIEEYLKTLPSSLPDESRRDIITKIVAASGFDYDLLMGDGVLRVKMLKDYAERFAHHTDDYVAARQSELEDLEQQMIRVRRLIENRRELHKKQFFAIEAEAQRLKELLTFITG